jgi:hypothetical protein
VNLSSAIGECSAATHGGGVYLNGGTLDSKSHARNTKI